MRSASEWKGQRVVVVDTETTGLSPTSRIVSVAFNTILEGRALTQFATLVDPGLPYIDAVEIHGITAEMLRAENAPSFAAIVADVQKVLTRRPGETVILAGFNVVFDALRLHYEFERLGLALPTGLPLLDVGSLAQRVGVSANSLADLAKSVGVTQDDAHTAVSDAHTATVALIALVKLLGAREPGVRLDALTTPFDPSIQRTRSGSIRATQPPTPPLTAAHLKAHAADLTAKSSREDALAVCLAEDCPDLASRCEYSASTTRDADAVVSWIQRQLERPMMRRTTRGRLLAGLSRVVARTENPKLIRAVFDHVDALLPGWGTCRARNRCDRCADPAGTRLCRFRSVRYAIIGAYMYEVGVLSEQRALEFLPFQPGAARKRGRRPTGWFGQLMRVKDFDAAGYGAQLAAQAGASSRKTGWERAILQFAWDQGARNAALADRYSARILADGPRAGADTHLDESLAVVEAALPGQRKEKGRVWGRLANRKARIVARQSAPKRARPATVRNGRPPRPNRFTLALISQMAMEVHQ